MSDPPPEFERFVIEEVRTDGETITVRYDGQVFGAIEAAALQATGAERGLAPGREIFIHYDRHRPGATGQVLQVIIRDPNVEAGWVELFSAWG